AVDGKRSGSRCGFGARAATPPQVTPPTPLARGARTARRADGKRRVVPGTEGTPPLPPGVPSIRQCEKRGQTPPHIPGFLATPLSAARRRLDAGGACNSVMPCETRLAAPIRCSP